ncbi:MAG: alginate export family protein [Chitinophagaceae bacterium]
MLKKSKKRHLLLVAVLCSAAGLTARSQFTLSGQLRTRTEIRNGLGNLVTKGSRSAAFTSQRTRLIIGYKWDRLAFGVSLQDVRVWGQDASSVSNADGNKFMLHEAWADLVLANKADTSIKFRLLDAMSVKIGRQELSYDDVRLLGNLDWLQQGRRHDMALLKTMHKGWQVDIGYAFNQNADAFGTTGTNYLPANIPAYIKNSLGNLVPAPVGMIPLANAGNAASSSSKTGTPVWVNPPNTNGGNQDYKSFTSVYISKKVKQTKFSGLFFNDNFGKYKLDSAGSGAAGYVYGRRFVSAGAADEFEYTGTHHRFTYGMMVVSNLGGGKRFGNLAIQAAYYAQSGRNRDAVKMNNAYHYTVALSWIKNSLTITPGYDVLSGNDPNTTADEKFDPLYGTPHKHWGYMDYFYAGTGSPAGGLDNAYLKFKHTSNRLTIGLDLHHFSLNKEMVKADGSRVEKNLGNEVDLLLSYKMNRFTDVDLGYSMMYASGNMPFAKGQAVTDTAAESYRKTGNWFYAMLKFTPDFMYAKTTKVK